MWPKRELKEEEDETGGEIDEVGLTAGQQKEAGSWEMQSLPFTEGEGSCGFVPVADEGGLPGSGPRPSLR